MARWSAGRIYSTDVEESRLVFLAVLNYTKDNGSAWFAKIKLYAYSKEEAAELQANMLSFLHTQELMGITYG